VDEALIRAGIMLDDERVTPDALEFTKDDRRHIGLEIHSGQNRVVRRIFEKVGYKVIALDRVSFAGLTKKNVARGKYRFLSPKEVSMLQMGAFE
jgi:23S rRNA pseudouridine2605 synthase